MTSSLLPLLWFYIRHNMLINPYLPYTQIYHAIFFSPLKPGKPGFYWIIRWSSGAAVVGVGQTVLKCTKVFVYFGNLTPGIYCQPPVLLLWLRWYRPKVWESNVGSGLVQVMLWWSDSDILNWFRVSSNSIPSDLSRLWRRVKEDTFQPWKHVHI